MSIRLAAWLAILLLNLCFLPGNSIFYPAEMIPVYKAATDTFSQRIRTLEEFDQACELVAVAVECYCLVWAGPKILRGLIALGKGERAGHRHAFWGFLILFLAWFGHSVLRWCLGAINEGRGFQ